MVPQNPGAVIDLPPAVAGPAFLRDGTEVWVRPVQPSDDELVRAFVERVSPESLERRYFTAIRPAAARDEIVATASVDRRLCLLVLGDRANAPAVLGVGEYVRGAGPATSAEVAFLVDEEYRGRGIATLLLARLARAASSFGVATFEARVRADNPEMLEVFRGSGLPLTEASSEGEINVRIPLVPEARTAGPSRSAPPPSVAPVPSGRRAVRAPG